MGQKITLSLLFYTTEREKNILLKSIAQQNDDILGTFFQQFIFPQKKKKIA